VPASNHPALHWADVGPRGAALSASLWPLLGRRGINSAPPSAQILRNQNCCLLSSTQLLPVVSVPPLLCTSSLPARRDPGRRGLLCISHFLVSSSVSTSPLLFLRCSSLVLDTRNRTLHTLNLKLHARQPRGSKHSSRESRHSCPSGASSCSGDDRPRVLLPYHGWSEYEPIFRASRKNASPRGEFRSQEVDEQVPLIGSTWPMRGYAVMAASKNRVRWTIRMIEVAGRVACSLSILDSRQQESSYGLQGKANRPHVKTSQVSCDVGSYGRQEKAS
jgi:hypothetical protein